MLKKSVSNDSFFKYNPSKPFVTSYGKFLQYCKYNNIIISKEIKKYALCMWWNYIDSFKKNNFEKSSNQIKNDI